MSRATDEDAALAERARGASQRVEPERESLLARLAQSLSPSILSPDELELIAERSIEPAESGWHFRWDRRVLDTDPVDPFAFLARVRCPVRVVAGAESSVMPPPQARRFAAALPDGMVEIIEGAGHHVELDAPELLSDRIGELSGA